MNSQERTAFIARWVLNELFFHEDRHFRDDPNPLAFLIDEAAAKAHGQGNHDPLYDMGHVLRRLDAELKASTGEGIGPDDLVYPDSEGQNVIMRGLLNENTTWFIQSFLSHDRSRFNISHCLAPVRGRDGASVPLGLFLIAKGVGSDGMLDQTNPLWLYFSPKNLEASAEKDLINFRRMVQEQANKYRSNLDEASGLALEKIIREIREHAPELLSAEQPEEKQYPSGVLTETFRAASGAWQTWHPTAAAINGKFKLFSHALKLLDRDPRLQPQPEAAPELVPA